jgi:hypothetical protein
MENLVEIKCPFEKRSKTNKEIYQCNRICVKVTPGSSGEARCRSCHLSFEFEVDSQAKMTTGVRVKPI